MTGNNCKKCGLPLTHFTFLIDGEIKTGWHCVACECGGQIDVHILKAENAKLREQRDALREALERCVQGLACFYSEDKPEYLQLAQAILEATKERP